MNTPSIDQFTRELAALLAPINQANGEKLKLIVHAGTPKTGTTSLQTYLSKKQGKLRRKGILYPHNISNITNASAPLHQWFEKNLLTKRFDFFLENFKNIVSQVHENTHSVILSSEGIYNYWWEFPDESKTLLRKLSTLFDVELWVWFRDPCEFIESFYKQCIRNPRVEGNPCYGKDLSFAQMLDIPWFSNQLNYAGFVVECQSLFGIENVKAFDYTNDTVKSVSLQFGLATPHDNPTVRLNNSLNSATVSMLRTLNQFDIKPKDKDRLMPELKTINDVLSTYDTGSLIDEKSKLRVLELANEVTFKKM